MLIAISGVTSFFSRVTFEVFNQSAKLDLANILLCSICTTAILTVSLSVGSSRFNSSVMLFIDVWLGRACLPGETEPTEVPGCELTWGRLLFVTKLDTIANALDTV